MGNLIRLIVAACMLGIAVAGVTAAPQRHVIAATHYCAVAGERVSRSKKSDKLPPEAVCPPIWKCNGKPETNAAGCDCWDRY